MAQSSPSHSQSAGVVISISSSTFVAPVSSLPSAGKTNPPDIAAALYSGHIGTD
jgi:hypothetical protein